MDFFKSPVFLDEAGGKRQKQSLSAGLENTKARGGIRRNTAVLFAFAVMMIALPVRAQDANSQYEFRIEGGALGSAMEEFQRITGAQLLFSNDLANVQGVKSLHGKYTSREALNIMLRDTGLAAGLTESGMIVITRAHSADAQNGEGEMASGKLKKSLLASAAAFLFGAGANAQDVERIPDNSEETAEQEKDEIIVTGSRIERPASQVAAQVMVLDRDALAATGEVNLERALRQLPQNNFSATEFGAALGSSINGAVNITGSSTLNLRGLGSESTLILVDGKRIGSSGAFGGASDISGIPLSAVDRVEILLDGASSIYGSDAVGGVVNIILRKDYKGLETAYTIGLPGEGGFEEHLASVAGGATWDSGRFHGAYEFFKSTDLDGSERAPRAPNLFNAPGNVSNFGRVLFYRYMGQNYLPADLPVAPDAPGVEEVFFAQLPAGQDGSALTVNDFTTTDAVLASTDAGRSLIPARERHTFQGGIDQELFGGVTFSGNVHYSTTDTVSGAGTPTVQIDVPGDSPINPFEDTFSFFPTATYWLVPELDTPYFDSEQNVLRWNAGLEGEIGDWNWSIDGSRSRDKSYSVRFNSFLFDFDDLITAGLNPFAGDLVGDNDPALVEQLQGPPQNVLNINRLSVASFNFDGPLFALPAGDVHLAVGGEWSSSTLDTESELSIFTGGINFAPGAPQGAFDRVVVKTKRKSAYGELFIPVIGSDNEFAVANQFDITGSVRYDDYETYGDATTWSVGAVWAPVEQVRFKFNRSTSFVVPTPREGLAPVAVTDWVALFGFPFSTLVVDENGIPTGEFDFEGGTITGGNPELEPETATSYTIGVELTPSFIPGLLVAASWHDTAYENRIARSPIAPFGFFPPDMVNYPELVFRDGNGNLFFDRRAANIASIDTSGIDYRATYSTETDIGQFILNAYVAYTHKWERIDRVGDAPLELVGQSNFNLTRGAIIPKYRYAANLTWAHRGMTVALDASTASDTVEVFDEGDNGLDVVQSTYDTPFLADLSLTYDFGAGSIMQGPQWLDGTSLSFRVVNLFNDQPTLTTTVDGGAVDINDTFAFGNSDIFDYNAALADPRGRVFYIGVRKEF